MEPVLSGTDVGLPLSIRIDLPSLIPQATGIRDLGVRAPEQDAVEALDLVKLATDRFIQESEGLPPAGTASVNRDIRLTPSKLHLSRLEIELLRLGDCRPAGRLAEWVCHRIGCRAGRFDRGNSCRDGSASHLIHP